MAPIVKYNYNDQIMFFSRLHISDLLTLCVASSLSHCASKLFQHKPIFLNYKSLKAGHYDSYASLSPDNVNVFFSPPQHQIHYCVPQRVGHKVYITLQQPMLLSHIRQSVVYFCAFSQLIHSVCALLCLRESELTS